MNILFIGTNVPDGEELTRKVSPAGNRFQNNVIKNLRLMGHKVLNLSFAPDGKGRAGTLLHALSLWYKTGRFVSAAELALCYDILWPWLDLPGRAKRKRAKSAVILADLSGPECFKDPLRKAYAGFMIRSLSRFDTVVGLSENVKKYLKPGQDFIYVPGGIDREFYDHFEEKDGLPGQTSDVFTAVFSGLLSPVTGADALICAMSFIDDPDIRLVITGRGELEEQIRAAASKDSRIVFKGLLPYEEYMEVLKSADVLLNPRCMSLPENQNNFPSKFMEYLGTGRPIISTRFAGWENFADNASYYDEGQGSSELMEKKAAAAVTPPAEEKSDTEPVEESAAPAAEEAPAEEKSDTEPVEENAVPADVEAPAEEPADTAPAKEDTVSVEDEALAKAGSALAEALLREKADRSRDRAGVIYRNNRETAKGYLWDVMLKKLVPDTKKENDFQFVDLNGSEGETSDT
ncbi:MAG: glycosyltransferase [Lachnospiraceae bacterium]|nr:glycosyltransferase [Lachnospiraceae bacterium]